MLSCPSSAEPKGHQTFIVKSYPENETQASISKLYLRKHLKSTTTSLCVTHKTWLSYSEISNYCNEILSERVKQYFLQFTHLDFLVNKLQGRWSTQITSEHSCSHHRSQRRQAGSFSCSVITWGNKVAENIKITEPWRTFFPCSSVPYLVGFFFKPSAREIFYFLLNDAYVHTHTPLPQSKLLTKLFW